MGDTQEAARPAQAPRLQVRPELRLPRQARVEGVLLRQVRGPSPPEPDDPVRPDELPAGVARLEQGPGRGERSLRGAQEERRGPSSEALALPGVHGDAGELPGPGPGSDEEAPRRQDDEHDHRPAAEREGNEAERIELRVEPEPEDEDDGESEEEEVPEGLRHATVQEDHPIALTTSNRPPSNTSVRRSALCSLDRNFSHWMRRWYWSAAVWSRRRWKTASARNSSLN